MASARFPRLSMFIGLAALFGAISPAFAFKIAYTVGSDGFCDFSDIPAAIAAAAANPPHNIYIAVNATYTAEGIVINNQDVNIVGGFANCSALVSPSGTSTISGALNGGKSVIAITGTSNVTLQNLTIRNGKRSADFTGGGIDFAGSGTLTLAASQVTNNTAGDGGGINVSGSPGPLELTIQANTLINSNTAINSGGGIRVVGNARLFMLEDFTYVAFNTATGGDGGGVQVLGPARADIGSPGYNLAAVINSNSAVNGGGISVDASQNNGQAILRMFSTDATRPVRISSNAASANGGGIYLKPYPTGNGGLPSHATLCAHDYRLDSNVGIEGSAIYVVGNTSDQQATDVLLQPTSVDTTGSGCDPETPESLGAVPCNVGAGCNMIDSNQAIDINNNDQATNGATIFGQSGIILEANRLMLRGNSGGYAVHGTGNTQIANFILSNCLIAENQLTHELALAENALLSINNCTLANDGIGATHVIRSDSTMVLKNSIIDEPGTLALDHSGAASDLTVAYVLSNDISTFPPVNPLYISGDPLFVGNGDYHLQAYVQNGLVTASHAIDYAPLVPGNDFDLDGRPRDQNVGQVQDVYGYRDLGAYEMQPIVDRIFADAFGDPTSLVY